MTREEILAKSRAENQDKDVFALEVKQKAQRIAGLSALAVAFLMMTAERIFELGTNYGYFAMILTAGMAMWLYRAIRLKRRRELLVAVIWGIGGVYALVMYIINFCQMIQ